jgi:hypothetical protein
MHSWMILDEEFTHFKVRKMKIQISRIGPEKKELIFQYVSLLLNELEGEESEFEGIDSTKIYREMEDLGDRFSAFMAITESGEVVGMMPVGNMGSLMKCMSLQIPVLRELARNSLLP